MTALFVAVDIGCIECGEPSQVLGIFTDPKRAASVCEEAETRQEADWGQHHFEVFEVPDVDRVGRTLIDDDDQWATSGRVVWE